MREKLETFAASAAVYGHPRVLRLFALGFSSGLPLFLSFSTLSVRLAESGVDKSTIGLFALTGVAYNFKFLWAPLIDRMPLPLLTRRLGQRRSWIVATHIACMGAIVGLGLTDPASDPWRCALFASLVAFTSASQDVVLDAYRIEILEKRQYGAGAATFVFGFRVGMAAAGAGALYLAEAYGWEIAHFVMAALLVVGLVVTLANPEPAREPDPETEEREARIADLLGAGAAARRLPGTATAARVHAWWRAFVHWFSGAVIAPFAEFVTRPRWIEILLFIVLYKVGDAALGTMSNPFYIELGFSKIDIANVTKLFSLAASLVGIFFGGMMIHGLGLIRSLLVAGILQALSNFAFVALHAAGPDVDMLALVVGVEAFTGGLGTAAFVAFLMSLCNVAYTATQFALVTSLMATARTFLSAPSGFIVEWLGDDWSAFFVLSGVVAFLALALLWRLRVLEPSDDSEQPLPTPPQARSVRASGET